MKVSIIIPVYNTEKYLKRCLNSVINQTLKDIEILIVLDGSNDKSINICNEYKKNDGRILIFEKENEGLGLTRNYGLQRASGEYVAFLDSDDFVDLDFYEKMFNSASKNNAEIAIGEFKYHTYDNKVYQTSICTLSDKKLNNPKDYLYSMLGKESYQKIGMSVWKCLYKRKFLLENNILFLSEREYISEDICFNFLVFELAKKAISVHNTYYYYCYNTVSLSHSYRKDRFEKTKKLIKKIVEYAEFFDELNDLSKTIDKLYIEYIKGIISSEVKNNKNIYKNIKNIITDDTVQKAVINVKNNKFKNKLICFFIKNRNVLPLIFIYKIRK